MIALVALMMLAGTDRCAVAALCPSDGEIIAALRGEEFDISAALNKDAEKTGSIVMVPSERILGVSDVYCDDHDAKTSTVWCKFTVRYPSHVDYRIAKLTRNDTRWQIVGGQVVTRRRRAER